MSEPQPLDGPFAFAATALCVGDRFFGRQRRAFGPGGVEVVVAYRITNSGDQGVEVGIEDHQADRPIRCRNVSAAPRSRAAS